MHSYIDANGIARRMEYAVISFAELARLFAGFFLA